MNTVDGQRCDEAGQFVVAQVTRTDFAPTLPGSPKAPVLGWSSFWPTGGSQLPSVGDLPHCAYTTSGRAALLYALKQLNLPSGSGVLVPTYHCPTMVAPVLQAGLTPVFFPIGPDGLPLLGGIPDSIAKRARVMFVAHYFGLPKSLRSVRRWCDERDIVLVEDCAHSYFGHAGERPVGTWGDLAAASLSKFFPVAEGGMLASAHRSLQPLGLTPAGLRAQLKGGFSVLEFAHLHGRLPGPSQVLGPLFWLKNRKRLQEEPGAPTECANVPPDADEMLASCDMDRVDKAPTLMTRALHGILPLGRIVEWRRRHYGAYSAALGQTWALTRGVRPLASHLPDDAAPYVFPLWLDNADRADALYMRLRSAGMPVFRWDRIWPGTPIDKQDSGPVWSRQVLQLLCHQDLTNEDVDKLVNSIRSFTQSV